MRYRLSSRVESMSIGGKPEGGRHMQVKAHIRVEGTERNHNETLVRAKPQTKGLTVKTGIKAGTLILEFAPFSVSTSRLIREQHNSR
jgi:hypothetical protein